MRRSNRGPIVTLRRPTIRLRHDYVPPGETTKLLLDRENCCIEVADGIPAADLAEALVEAAFRLAEAEINERLNPRPLLDVNC
jgi:hypothetical protein